MLSWGDSEARRPRHYTYLIEPTDGIRYETFTEVALQFRGAKAIELCDIQAPLSPGFPTFTSSELMKRLKNAGINLDSLNFKERGAKVQSKARKLQILQKDLEQPVRVHGEIQILMQLVNAKSDSTSGLKEFDYIGYSKRSCYFCSCLVKGFYRMRGSHGKVYPRWTISSPSLLKSWTCLKLHSKVSEIGASMMEQLKSSVSYKPPYVAESSAGMTATFVLKSTHKYRGLLDREAARSEKSADSTAPEPLLGQELKKILVLRIPADGTDPTIVHMPIRKTNKAFKSKDYIAWDVPDFGRFWDGQMNFERNFHPVGITNQENIEPNFQVMNGQYWIYFNCSEELLPNEYLKTRLVDGVIPNERKFWNGDVFVVKLATRWIDAPNLEGFIETGVERKIEVEYDDNACTMYQDVSFFETLTSNKVFDTD